MDSILSYKICDTQVVHEIIEGEAVIINLETGNYYSLRGAGADIWDLIGAGAMTTQIIKGIDFRYQGDPKEIKKGVEQLIDQLLEQGLIELTTLDNADQADDEMNHNLNVSKPNFKMPSLEIYDDMQDLLLLDPIHDVDETGWPQPAPE